MEIIDIKEKLYILKVKLEIFKLLILKFIAS